jgi:hypothetical protein
MPENVGRESDMVAVDPDPGGGAPNMDIFDKIKNQKSKITREKKKKKSRPPPHQGLDNAAAARRL